MLWIVTTACFAGMTSEHKRCHKTAIFWCYRNSAGNGCHLAQQQMYGPMNRLQLRLACPRAVLRLALLAMLLLGYEPSEGVGATALDAHNERAMQQQRFYDAHFTRRPSVAELTDLGRKMFFDPNLSASSALSCASCHDPRYAFA